MESLTQKKSKFRKLMSIVVAVAMMTTIFMSIAPASADSGVPEVATGRILTAADVGDASDWIEIARYGDYSLILRTNYISWNYNAIFYQGSSSKGFNDPFWNWSPFCTTTNNMPISYDRSFVRNNINEWFNGTSRVENLDKHARLRDFTMQSNAVFALGSVADPKKSLYDGLSYPTGFQVGIGNDIAFALSFSEASLFCSQQHFLGGSAYTQSHQYAKMNYKKVNIPNKMQHFMWLRSIGGCYNGYAGALLSEYYPASAGAVNQSCNTNNGNSCGYTYPAVWVGQGIFNTTPPPPPPPTHYTVKYDPNGGNGEVKSFQVEKDNYHIITDVGFTKPNSTLAGWNTDRNGNGTPYAVYDFIQTVNSDITLYAQWKATSVIIYNPNFDNGSEIIDEGLNNNFIIKQNPFTRANYTFKNWNTSPDGSGATLPAGLAMNGFRGTLRLYAIWSRVS